jgi:hypothetical protein
MFYSPRCVLAADCGPKDDMLVLFSYTSVSSITSGCQLLTDTHHGITYILHAGEVANFAGYDKYKH